MSNIAFTSDFWDWLRGIKASEPKPSDYGLGDLEAHALRRQVEIEYQSRVGKIPPRCVRNEPAQQGQVDLFNQPK